MIPSESTTKSVLLSGFDKQSEIDIPMDKIDVLFDSESPIKWDRIVQNGGGESSEQGGKLWYNAIGRVLQWHFADAGSGNDDYLFEKILEKS
jgi:hypothetical protein